MTKRKDILNYNKNLKIGLIISLALSIFTFLVYPYPKISNDVTPVYGDPIITVMDIPATNQSSTPQMAAPQPQPVITNLFFEIDDPEILDDVELDDNTLASSDNVGDGAVESLGGTGPRVLNSLPFAPRQILWVVPAKDDDIDGFVTFSLKIGTNGMVKDHRIVKNTIKEPGFVDNVIASLYKCKWAPVVMEGEKVEFWIELKYQ